jgi:GNAT superfamily N-acetyltransferase/nitroimidazol reductase NimA-like FMN-containing flavoprotein (pyridoxamine 5'-phosphate oxidase superfamily)
MPHEDAIAMLQGAPYVHLASSTPDGAPVLRAVHGVVCDGMVCFHGAPVGEKTTLVGREAVLSYEEVIAEVPSYWTDPVLACPATTLYVSVQVHGVLRTLDEPERKARALQALMERYQPEGGHTPITADDAMYRKNIAGVSVWAIALDRVDGKAKLAQNRSAAHVATLVERLWERGCERDPRALELVLAANPAVARPTFLRGPHGSTLHGWNDLRAFDEILPLLRDEYWNHRRFDDAQLRSVHHSAAAWVTARAPDGALIATARAVSDGVKYAYIGDVAVHRDWRNRGVGAALMALLLSHPMLRNVARTELGTRDAQHFYERFGFRVVHEEALGPWTRRTMARVVKAPPVTL